MLKVSSEDQIRQWIYSEIDSIKKDILKLEKAINKLSVDLLINLDKIQVKKVEYDKLKSQELKLYEMIGCMDRKLESNHIISEEWTNDNTFRCDSCGEEFRVYYKDESTTNFCPNCASRDLSGIGEE